MTFIFSNQRCWRHVYTAIVKFDELWEPSVAMLNGVKSMSIFSLFGSCRNKCMYSKFVVNAVNLLVFLLCLLLLLKHTLHIGLSVFQWHRLTVIIAMNGIYLLLAILFCYFFIYFILFYFAFAVRGETWALKHTKPTRYLILPPLWPVCVYVW